MKEKEKIGYLANYGGLDGFQKELRKSKSTYARITKWKERALEENDDVNKFIFRWISFNGLYQASFEMAHSPDGQEKAFNIPEWRIVKNFCDNFILTDDKLASKIYSSALENDFLDNIREKSRYMGEYLEGLKSANSMEEKSKYLVLVAYKIRCRLFHGEKNPLLDVDKVVVKAADQVIDTILNYIIREQ